MTAFFWKLLLLVLSGPSTRQSGKIQKRVGYSREILDKAMVEVDKT